MKNQIIIWCLYYNWFNFAKVSNFGKVNTAKTTEIAIFCIKLMYLICKIIPVLTSEEEKNIKSTLFCDFTKLNYSKSGLLLIL